MRQLLQSWIICVLSEISLHLLGNNETSAFYEDPATFNVQEGYHILWNSLCVSKGDIVAALASTDAYFHSLSKIWMTKKYVTRK